MLPRVWISSYSWRRREETNLQKQATLSGMYLSTHTMWPHHNVNTCVDYALLLQQQCPRHAHIWNPLCFQCYFCVLLGAKMPGGSSTCMVEERSRRTLSKVPKYFRYQHNECSRQLEKQTSTSVHYKQQMKENAVVCKKVTPGESYCSPVAYNKKQIHITGK